MTNERWRAEMPTNFVAVDDGSDEPLRCVEEATHLELVTRANAELDAAEAEKAALKQGNTELRALLEASWETTERLETEKSALTKERDELRRELKAADKAEEVSRG